jgi:ubiquinone/menaquinone biosynthesis C-methylase UbiE
VTPAVRDASDPALSGRYDLVTIFEALHDMNHPVEALRTARRMLAEGGSVLVADHPCRKPPLLT